MMLQGHFIDTLLNPIHRDEAHTVYQIWSYFRGITAPTFFTISGLVFMYLLLRARDKGNDGSRLKKGLYRGLLLLGIGYALRINFSNWFQGQFNGNTLAVDVLQCIGLSLILLILIYRLFRLNSYILSIVLVTLGCLSFLTEPLYRTLNLEQVPLLFSNYMTKANGSVFTILPWFGYTAFGAFLATVFFRHVHRKRFKIVTVLTFFVVGLLLIYKSSWLLVRLYRLTDIELFNAVAYYNYLFTRFGNVLLLFGVFYSFETLWRQSIITKIGEKTLSIYVIHFIIIFGSFTGLGLRHFFYEALNPTEAIIGALLFIFIVCFISFYYVKTNAFIYKGVRKCIKLIKKQ